MRNLVRQPQQERSIEKKHRIINAGYQLFSEVGYYGTNTVEIAKLFELLFDAVFNSSAELLLESSAYVSLIVARIKKADMIVSRKGKAKKTIFASAVQEYLAKHFGEQITSLDISRDLFYNQSYFCRLFRENFGVSFLEYLMLYRISSARLLLSAGNLRVSDVAERVGFLDASYFSRWFKKSCGIAPSEYQKIFK